MYSFELVFLYSVHNFEHLLLEEDDVILSIHLHDPNCASTTDVLSFLFRDTSSDSKVKI